MKSLSLLAAALLAPCLALSAIPARAEMIETPQLLAPSATEGQSAQVAAFLEREDVQRQLESFGVSPGDAATRVASLTAAELHELSSGIDSLPAGAGVSTLGLILIILLIVVLI